MKTQDMVETSVYSFDNDNCPRISASGVSLSVIMLVPSHAEFFPIIIMYSLQCKILVVSTKAGRQIVYNLLSCTHVAAGRPWSLFALCISLSEEMHV